MKANKYKRFFEFVAVLCLFLAVGADWPTWGCNHMNRCHFEQFEITSEYSSYISPRVAEQAVDQAIAAAERREQRDQTARAKVRVSVMGEKYTVENLQFDGFLSWKRQLIDVQAMAIEKAREIHRLAFEVQILQLARVETSFHPVHLLFTCSVWPVNTTSFNQAFSVNIIPSLMGQYPEVESTQFDLSSLDAAEQFLSGLIEDNRPFIIEEAAA